MNESPHILHFHNHTDAALCVCRLRADGNRAYLLDEATSWLWGPLAVGGIRVAVYPQDDENSEEEEIPEPPKRDIFPDFVGIVALAFVSFGLIRLVVMFFNNGRAFFDVLGFMLKVVVLPAAFVLLMMPLLLALTNQVREPGSHLRIFLGIIILIVSFLALLFLDWGWG
jgi:hypothetical protein